MTAGSIMERVIVKLDMVSKGFQNSMNRANMATQGFRKGLSDAGHALNMPIQNMKIMDRQGFLMKTSLGRAAMGVRHMTHGLRGFRMEMLGTMFFGMMLQQMFLGFLRPVMEAFGVFDLFRMMLLVLFIPVMEMIFPLLLKFMDWVMSWSKETKEIVGILTLIGVAVGFLLFALGSLALGIGSLILVLPTISTLAPYLLAGGVALVGLVTAFVKGKKDIKDFIDKISSWFKDLKPNIEKAGGAFEFFQKTIFDILTRIPIIGPIYKLLGKMWTTIKGYFEAEDKYAFLSDIITTWFDKLKEDSGVFGAIARFIDKVWTKISDFIRGITTFGDDVKKMIENTPDATWKDIGVYIATQILRGLTTYLTDSLAALDFRNPKEMVKDLNRQLDAASSKVDTVKRKASYQIPTTTKYGKDPWAAIGQSNPLGDFSKLLKFDDFIWRSGSGAAAISPDDTVMGFKGDMPGGGSVTNNFYGFTMDDLNRELDDRDRRMVDEVRRLVKE